MESDDEPESEEPMDDFQKLEYWAKKHVMHYRSRLLPDHVRAAYLCSPNPDVIKHAVDPNNLDPEDRMACERLLKKLMVPAGIVDEQERERVEAEVIDTFLTELEQFQTKSGPFQPRHMWIIAENSKTLAHEWHHKYSFPFTKIMGKFACYVTSKPTGIGGAERHWKAVKRNKKGKRGNLSTDKAKKLSCITAAYSYERAALRREESQKAGKLWEDDDFENYNNFCSQQLLEIPMTVTRIFRAWEEGWEKVQFNSAGDEKFAARFSAKYENLMWYDPDSKKMMHSAVGDCAVLIKLDKNSERKREKGKGWAYVLLGMYDDVYDEDKSRLENDPSSYEFYEMSSAGGEDFYWMVSEFYKNNPVPGFRICAHDECDSLGDMSDEDESNDGDGGANKGTE